jgi:ankyrin repeat protein
LIIASQNRALEIVEELLSLKKPDGSLAVNVNQANMDGVTALLAACKRGSFFTVELLLDAQGIDVNQADNNGETPLKITKGTQIHGLLEYWLVGEVHASKHCSALSAENRR